MLVHLAALALLSAAPTSEPTFEPSYAAARERASSEQRVLFVALLAEGEGRSLALAEAMRASALEPWLADGVNVVAELATGAAGRRRKGFEGLTAEQMRAIAPELREGLLRANDSGVVAVPQVAWLAPDGAVLASVPYELTPAELAWCFAFAHERAGKALAHELPSGARAPRRLLVGELFRPAQGDAYGRGMTPAELELEVERRRSDPFGGGAVGSWLRILFTDEPEAVALAEVDLSRGMLGWLSGERMNQTIDYVGTVSPPDFWKVIEPYASDDSVELRLRVAAALEQIGSQDALKLVKGALDDEKAAPVRHAWLRALGACAGADKGARKKLVSVLGSKREEPAARQCAAVALGYLAPDEELRALLVELLAAEELDLRLSAAAAMALARDGAQIPALEAALERATEPAEKDGLQAALEVVRGAALTRVESLVQVVTRDDHPRPRLFFRADPAPPPAPPEEGR